MELSLSLTFAALIGFSHAFEADHLVAVGNIVTKREKMGLAIKDGIFWGLGHSSTIMVIGLLIIVSKVAIPQAYFGYFEAAVGVMLVLLGFYRLGYFFKYKKHYAQLMDHDDNHHLAYGVGLVHGLAGSGALVLLVMSEISDSFASIIYLLIFGVGSIAGMLLAAGLFSLPFSRRLAGRNIIQPALIVISSVLCVGYGAWVVFENLS